MRRWAQDQGKPQRHNPSHKIDNKFWRLYSDIPIQPSWKSILPLGSKVSTKLSSKMDIAMYSPPHTTCWYKISTLDSTSHHLVDWEAPRLATKKVPRTWQRWATRIASQQLPTGTSHQNEAPDPLKNSQEDVVTYQKTTLMCSNDQKETPHDTEYRKSSTNGVNAIYQPLNCYQKSCTESHHDNKFNHRQHISLSLFQ